jgi:hypothetical protein
VRSLRSIAPVTPRIALTLVLLLAPSAGAQISFRANATIADDGTPVVLYPDPSRPALTRLAAGTPIRTGDSEGDWVNVVFQDPRFGRRVGYVLRQHVLKDGTRLAEPPRKDPTTTLTGGTVGAVAMLTTIPPRMSMAELVRAGAPLITSDRISLERDGVTAASRSRRSVSQQNAPRPVAAPKTRRR